MNFGLVQNSAFFLVCLFFKLFCELFFEIAKQALLWILEMVILLSSGLWRWLSLTFPLSRSYMHSLCRICIVTSQTLSMVDGSKASSSIDFVTCDCIWTSIDEEARQQVWWRGKLGWSMLGAAQRIANRAKCLDIAFVIFYNIFPFWSLATQRKTQLRHHCGACYSIVIFAKEIINCDFGQCVDFLINA